MKYTHLLFDLDGTLFDFNSAEKKAFSNTCREFNIPCTDETIELYHQINSAYWKMYERGEISRPALSIARYKDLLSSLNIEKEPSAVSKFYEYHLGQDNTPLPGAVSLCETLYNKGYSLHIITNGAAPTQKNRLRDSAITKYLSGIFISEIMGAQKPDGAYFDIVLSDLKITPDKALIIGDTLSSDIRGGVDYGIDTCWYNPSHMANTYTDITPTYEVDSFNKLIELL